MPPGDRLLTLGAILFASPLILVLGIAMVLAGAMPAVVRMGWRSGQ